MKFDKDDPNAPTGEEFRRALGCFATGIAVATTTDDAGQRTGITISSFNSVSLDPPLVLWSIGKDSLSYDAFANAEHFAVNVLAEDQVDLCERFASKGPHKFKGLNCIVGMHGDPLLPGRAAVFECSTEHRYDGGDHTILVGRVQRFADCKREPLIFHRGQYLRKGPAAV